MDHKHTTADIPTVFQAVSLQPASFDLQTSKLQTPSLQATSLHLCGFKLQVFNIGAKLEALLRIRRDLVNKPADTPPLYRRCLLRHLDAADVQAAALLSIRRNLLT
jgi:hypothetical protein